jgi:hypothetical protein
MVAILAVEKPKNHHYESQKKSDGATQYRGNKISDFFKKLFDFNINSFH